MVGHRKLVVLRATVGVIASVKISFRLELQFRNPSSSNALRGPETGELDVREVVRGSGVVLGGLVEAVDGALLGGQLLLLLPHGR